MMESAYLLCDSHVVHAAFFSEHHGEHARLSWRLIDQLHPEMVIKMSFRDDKSGTTHFFPVKQETIYQSPYYFFVISSIFFDGFKFFDPFLAYFLFDLNLLLFIQVIMASVIG